MKLRQVHNSMALLLYVIVMKMPTVNMGFRTAQAWPVKHEYNVILMQG